MRILNKVYADIFYDNTTSGLTATTIQAALDELNANKANINISSSNTTVDTSGFSGVLSSSDTNVQAALETLDAIDGTGIAYDNSNTNLIATNIQQAIDALYALLFPEIASFDGGAPDTNNFVYVLDGGDPSTEPDQSVDGGDPQGPTVDGGDS